MTTAAGRPVAVHQFLPALNPHDATGTHTLKLREVLRAAGWRSEIFAEAVHEDMAAEAYKHWMYPEHAADGDVAVYQFTTSSAVAPYLAEQGLPLILDFHNFTSPELFAGWEPGNVTRAAQAADDLALLAPEALLGLARSDYSEQTLTARGLPAHAVTPALADYARVTANPIPGSRPSSRNAGPQRAARTSSSWAGSCRPRRSTNW